MRKRSAFNAVIIGATTWLLACGGDQAAQAAPGAADPSYDSPELTVVDNPINANELRPFLPESLLGHARGEIEEKEVTTEMARSTSVAAGYGAGVAAIPAVSVKIYDYGASEYMLKTFGMLRWESEETTPDGVVRISKYQGHPTMEHESRRGSYVASSMEIFVGDRYVVEITANQMALDELHEAAAAFELSGLAKLGRS